MGEGGAGQVGACQGAQEAAETTKTSDTAVMQPCSLNAEPRGMPACTLTRADAAVDMSMHTRWGGSQCCRQAQSKSRKLELLTRNSGLPKTLARYAAIDDDMVSPRAGYLCVYWKVTCRAGSAECARGAITGSHK